MLNRFFELNYSLNPKVQAVNKAQRQPRPKPYFPEFLKSRALKKQGQLKYRVSQETLQLLNSFEMSSSIYCFKCLRLFEVYFVKQIFSSNMFYFKSILPLYDCHIIHFYYSIRYETTKQIIEEDIANHSPTVVKFFWKRIINDSFDVC